jgi:putative DNA methylase
MAEYRKKLIEVALPLEAINRESAREKSIRHGHPSTLHLWWARRPLAACRAVLFASIVDDPSSRPDEFPTEEDQELERQRLFRIIEELVKWENSNNERVLEKARAEVMKATDGNPPPVLDPFCGAGSIPLEAQRLGLEAHASDLNPVAVLITKAMIEIPSAFAGRPPANPESREKLGHGASWTGAQGLAEDIRYYGRWIREQAFERIGHLYPNAKLPGGGEATVIAWLWARTTQCSNPACGAEIPLIRGLDLSSKRGREKSLELSVNAEAKSVGVQVVRGKASGHGTAGRHGAHCLVCGTVMPLPDVRRNAQAAGLGRRLLAAVVETDGGRDFVDADAIDVVQVESSDIWAPEELVTTPSHDVDRLPMYGMKRWRDAFTERQLLAASTVAALIPEAARQAESDGADHNYAAALTTYLAFGLDRALNTLCTLARWTPAREQTVTAFARQALPMTWDFPEVNPFAGAAGDIAVSISGVAEALEGIPKKTPPGIVRQLDARAIERVWGKSIVATDPPYYDNVGYADLSDFFYVWLRQSLKDLYPSLFSTLLAPKDQELVAMPHRHNGGRSAAAAYFESGLRQTFASIHELQDVNFPFTLFYAFRQAEASDGGAVSSTGWDTMLTGLLESGFAVTGTWPVRSELTNRTIASGTNALASSIVLVCRPRPADAPIATRRELVNALRAELPQSLKELQHGSVAPVDLAQAAIGPGMAVFSRYSKVLEADGTPMTVRAALGLINQALDEILAEQEGEFDSDTRFAVTWFEQRGSSEGPYGEAEVLAKAKDTSVDGMVEAGVLFSRAGKVRLLNRDEMTDGWDPVSDHRPTAWEAAQHLTKRLAHGGEDAAAELLRRLGGAYGEQARELAYRLYSICERKGWAQEAMPYNALVVAWPEIARRVAGTPEAEAQQALEL